MKATFIFPGIAASGFNRSGKRIESLWINHGLCSISAYAKSRGFEIDLIDLRQLSGWDEFTRAIKDKPPDVVGITMMSVDYGYAIKCVEIIKKLDSRIQIVLGGPHPSIETKEAEDNPDIDYIILGEGEIGFTKLLSELRQGRHPERVLRGQQPELDSIPFVDRELFKCRETPIERFLPEPFVTIICGRGCKYNCSFCQPAERLIFGKDVRRRSVANVIEELREIRRRFNFKSFLIHDDCLTEDMKWIGEFCDALRQNGFRQPWVCQTRADIICRFSKEIKKMKAAGLCMFLVGFESGSQRILNFLRKGITVEQNLEAALICRRLGIRIWANYMVGIPTETKEEVADTVNFIKRIKPYRPSPAYFTPHPGSDLYKWCVEKDISLIKDHSDYSRGPDRPKIKGIDYGFLEGAVAESKKRFLSVRLKRKLDFIAHRRIGPFLNRVDGLHTWSLQ